MSCVLLLLCASAQAGTNLNFGDPTQFFTNVAARLLKSELGQDFARIQIYPTNQYTPAVHRLLQVTANGYDSITNRTDTGYPYLPHVFRPLFRKAGTNLFICGYEEVPNVTAGDAVLDLPFELEDLAQNGQHDTDGAIIRSNVYNVPWIVGAKKGWPNFNEFSMQNAIYAARRLEFRRLNVNGDPNDPANGVHYTNQLHSIGVSNVIGVETWNSYSNTFPRPLIMSARVEITASIYGTDSMQHFGITNVVTAVLQTNLAANSWRGITNDNFGNVIIPQATFTIPVLTNFIFFATNYGFVQSPNGFNGVQGGFQNVGDNFPVPRWWSKLNSRVCYFLLDGTNVVDYVSLSRDEAELDVTALLMQGTSGQVSDSSPGGQWVTNRLNNSSSPSTPTVGILNQILASEGQIALSWNAYNYDAAVGRDKDKAIGFFNYQFLQNVPGSHYQKTNVFYAPYTPFRAIFRHISWQVDDPLVHYTLPDMFDSSLNGVDFVQNNPTLQNIRSVNRRYTPWGGNPGRADPSSDFNLAIKDALVYQSDDWQFATNLLSDLSQIGKIHRGTPWQSIYLKSSDIAANVWSTWTGNTNFADLFRTKPTNDWRLASLIVSLLSTNDPHRLLSPNNPDTNAWLNALNGLLVLTNTIAGAPLYGQTPEFDQLVMTFSSPQAAAIVDALNIVRNSQPNHRFVSPGDVLATPKLSVKSPWLNFDIDQALYGISDEAYEKIPAQLLLLLREDSVGSTIVSNNQFFVQFTGYDGYSYAFQVSSNLVEWVSISTNSPVGGVFNLADSLAGERPGLFYRSVLLP